MGRKKAPTEGDALVRQRDELEPVPGQEREAVGGAAHDVLHLQTQVGNRAVQRAIGQRPVMPRPSPDPGDLPQIPARTVRCPRCGHEFEP